MSQIVENGRGVEKRTREPSAILIDRDVFVGRPRRLLAQSDINCAIPNVSECAVVASGRALHYTAEDLFAT